MLVNANQIEAQHGYTGASRELSIGQSLAYIEKATNTTGEKRPMLAAGAPVGNYVVFATTLDGQNGHVMYGQVLPNGRAYFYDPQLGGGKALAYDDLRKKYTDMKTYFMKEKK